MKTKQYKLMNDNWILSTIGRRWSGSTYAPRENMTKEQLQSELVSLRARVDMNIFGCINLLLIVALTDKIDKINKIKTIVNRGET
jgi:hypothetical protein